MFVRNEARMSVFEMNSQQTFCVSLFFYYYYLKLFINYFILFETALLSKPKTKHRKKNEKQYD